nr:thiamine pyrophosphate-binding protein [Angustibacter aerolatus]
MTTVADHIIERLAAWGVTRYYGYPGDGINGMTSALQRAQDRTEFVQVRHEETAGFAATAHVKYGGGPIGAALVTSGPGAVHLLNGLYDARLDHQPVVALVGQTALTAQGGGYYQEPRPAEPLQGRRGRLPRPGSTTRRRCGTSSTGPAARRWRSAR